MEARGVRWGDVIEAVRNAEVTDRQGDRTRYFYRDLCVVVAESTVVTVLLRESKHWTSAEMRARRSSLE